MTKADGPFGLPTDIDDISVRNFINGQWQPPKTSEYIPTVCPATGNKLTDIPDSGEADIDDAVCAAKTAFKSWSKTTVEQRVSVLLRIADLIDKHASVLAKFESMDQGKTLSLATRHEIPCCSHIFRLFADIASKGFAESKGSVPFGSSPMEISDMQPCTVDSETQHVAAGVAAIITPWNVPMVMVSQKLAPCIAAGSTCVIKPTELCGITTYLFTHILKEAGVPDGVVNVVFGTGERAGEPLVRHKDVRVVSFTGGTKTGYRIGMVAGGLNKRVFMELGGKSPSLVFDDCDIHHAVATGVRSIYHNQGEICMAASRHYVQKPIFEQYLQLFREKTVGKLRVGNPEDPRTYYGALVSQTHMDKVTGYIRMAQKEGATVEFLVDPDDPEITGVSSDGRLTIRGFENGYFVAPTLITNIRQSSPVVQEEIFGPVVCVLPFDSEDEAVELANDCKYGLAASVWSLDQQRLDRVMRQINAGTVWSNTWFALNFAMPFGGFGCSGNSREFGLWSMEIFSEIKTLSHNRYRRPH
ncbi:hypothetical protein LPJ56_000146 [Coemansia sp. RSA 2599]|nr:hypothetical protein LPJ75_000047 [Coemansia sp. RSA 2598]KAJ1829627.1 hypothetical protein LPJ56_000146 [Coemansia sp. RSA 2599]